MASRNPFGVPDVGDPLGPDVLAFAEEKLALPNGHGRGVALDGFWRGHWDRQQPSLDLGGGHSGEATFVERDRRVFVLYRDVSTYLIESRRSGDVLMGRYQNLDLLADSTPWVGVIASDTRVYGLWAKGRWDFDR